MSEHLSPCMSHPLGAGPAPPPPADPGDHRPLLIEDRRRAFLQMVSHELRTPLNAILGFSDVIRRELHGPIGDPRYRQHAEVIRENGLQLLKLFNQVMELTRLDTGVAELDIRTEPVGPIVEQALEAIDEEAAARGVRVRLLLDPVTPPVLADPRGLQTVLVNLLQNAIAASPRRAEVILAVRPCGDSVLLEVVDTGDGVRSEDIPRLMLPFEQGDAPLTRRTAGAGLGLPIARALCDDMGGRLHLVSAPGRGLAARVWLPAAALKRDDRRAALEPGLTHA